MEEELRMWCAIRTDLGMSPGKMAVQVGHACQFHAMKTFVGEAGRALFERYIAGGGTKIAVAVKSEVEMLRVIERCRTFGIAHEAIIDAGRTELAGPTLTVVAFGPCRRDELPPFLKKLRLLTTQSP